MMYDGEAFNPHDSASEITRYQELFAHGHCLCPLLPLVGLSEFKIEFQMLGAFIEKKPEAGTERPTLLPVDTLSVSPPEKRR